MNLNHSSSDTGACLIQSCPAVVQALYILSLRSTLSAYQTEMNCS
jgi:hypothetical protein